MIHHPVLDQLAASGVKLGLERVRSFLTYIQEPQRAYPSVHIAGTNGKGSVCAFVSTVLVEAGYRVGTNYSPHLEAVNERIQVNNRAIDDASLIEALEAQDRLRWEWAQNHGITGVPLTYFEFVTTLAMSVFAQRAVDVGVFEVGLGGRLDATNVLEPIVTAITSIGLDHVDQLGDTEAAIAKEKAGILKRGVPMVIGPMSTEARETVEALAQQFNAPLWKPGRDLAREYRSGRWSFRTPEGVLSDVTLGLEGVHQGSNALVALGILHSLRRQGFHVPDDAVRSGFANTYLAGRIERLKPGLVADGAHNEAGAKALAKWLDRQPRPANRILLLGVGEDRDPNAVLTPLLPYIDEVVTTRCSHPKAMEPASIAGAIHDLPETVILAEGPPIDDLLAEVFVEADETLVAGSLFLAGAAKSIVRAGKLDGLVAGSAPPPQGDDAG